MLDQTHLAPGFLRAERPTPLPVAALVLGKSPEEAAALLPRLFNLCRMAQGAAARLAFGLPLGPEGAEAIRQEILREHLAKFCVTFPARLGLAPAALPEGWQASAPGARAALFGRAGLLPQTFADFTAFLATGEGVAGILAHIRDRFAPGDACAGVLPSVTAANALTIVPLENSVAGRQAGHPVLQGIETRYGRGPLWRATARAYDARDCMIGRLPKAVCPRPGFAFVPAARGSYAIAAAVEARRVTAFQRVTPTDHLVAPGGILDQSLASLPPEKKDLAGLVVDILDPCTPLRLREMDHA